MEDYDKLTKSELLARLLLQENELEFLRKSKGDDESKNRQIAELTTTRDNAINAEYEVRKELEKATIRMTQAMKDKEYFKGELDALTDLFNEYVNAYKDQVAMTSIFVNNSKSIMQLMDSKIAVFNARPKGPNKE